MITAKDLEECGEWKSKPEEMERFVGQVNEMLRFDEPTEKWQGICLLLSPQTPIEIHEFLYNLCYRNTPKHGLKPAWIPSRDTFESSNISKALKHFNLSSFEQLHKLSITDSEAFWKYTTNALDIRFNREPECMIRYLDQTNTSFEYLPNALMNIAESCFNRSNPSSKPAIIFKASNSSEISEWSLQQLQSLSNQVSNMLYGPLCGLSAGDAVAIDMVMTAESIAIYLGIIQAGMVVVSIADSFSAEQIQIRLEESRAKLVFTQDFIYRGTKAIPLYERVLQAKPLQCIVINGKNALLPLPESSSKRSNDLQWSQILAEPTEFSPITRRSSSPSNILFSSGTTGTPKAIPWRHSSPLKPAMDAHFHQNIQRGDVVCWPTNLGWMMGPWLIYAALLNDASIALFYDSPISSGFPLFVQEAKITMLGVVPSIVKAWKASKVLENTNWDSIKVFSSTGETSDPSDYFWLMSRVKGYAPVIEYCGGTEISGGYISGTVVQPQVPSMFSAVSLGLDIALLQEESSKDLEESGEVAITTPSIGLSTSLMNRDHYSVYYEGMPKGMRRHGDELERIGKYYRALGRADDTMNLGGIKVSSIDLEQCCNKVEGVRETAAIAYNPVSGGPSRLVVFAVVSEGFDEKSRLLQEFQTMIKIHLNPLFHVFDTVVIDKLPRTASNKVMRRELRKQYAEMQTTE